MGIFEDMYVNAKEVADMVGRKAGACVDISKLKIAQGNLKNEIQKKLKELGSKVYSSYKNDENPDISNEISQLDDLKQQYYDIQNMIYEATNKVKCPKCGEVQNKGNLFCDKCGSQLTDI